MDLENGTDLSVIDHQITLITAAHDALAKARSAPDIKKVVDWSAAATVYARRQKLSDETIGMAHALQIEALDKLGSAIKEMEKNKGGRPSKPGAGKDPVIYCPTLEEQGIGKKLSARARAVHGLPEDDKLAVANRKLSLPIAIAKHRHKTAVRPPLPDGKFRVIYADPPWPCGDRGALDMYLTMTIDAICAMDIESRAADDSVLFMWATAPLLPEALTVLTAWGFTYRQNFVWDKVGPPLVGAYHGCQHEHLLVATRGKCPPDRQTPLLDSVLSIEKSRRHSEKPAAFREMIERLYDAPYLELFARHLTPGWTTFGNDPALERAA